MIDFIFNFDQLLTFNAIHVEFKIILLFLKKKGKY